MTDRRDVKILDFIQRYCGEHGYSPTNEEIGEAVGLSSKASVHRRLHQLRRAERVTFVDGERRTIRLSKEEAEQYYPFGRLADDDPVDQAVVRAFNGPPK